MPTDGLPEWDRHGLLTLAPALPLLLIVAWLAHTTIINHDSAWALYVGQAMLAGAQLYQDIIEVNPPLAFALTVPPVWISNLAGVDPIDIYFFWIFAQTGLSLVVTAAVIRRLPGWRGFWGAGLVLAVLAALILGAWNQIGQREHLLMIFVTPYLLLAGARSSGVKISPGLAVTVGALAAIGFALKPHFLLVPTLVELRLLTRSRDYRNLVRPETVTIVAFIAGYWAWVALFMPVYFSRIVPWGLEVYFAYSSPIEQIWLRGELLLLLLALGFHIVDSRKTDLGRVIEILLVAAVATYAIYVIQQKGFAYHLFPLRTLLILIFGFGLLAQTRKAQSAGSTNRIGLWIPAIVQGAMFAAICGWMIAVGSYVNGFYEKALPVVRQHSAGGPAYVFGTNVSLGFPLISYSRLETSWRYPTHWLLPGLIRLGDAADEGSPARRERLRSIGRYVVDSVIEDFERHRPELVLVDVRPNKSYFADTPFDYLSYFLADPRFVPIWAQYRKVAELDEAHLYRRTGGGAE